MHAFALICRVFRKYIFARYISLTLLTFDQRMKQTCFFLFNSAKVLISKVYCRPHSESLSSWLQFLELWGSYPSLPQSHHWLSTRLMVYNIYIFTLKILYDSITDFYKPTTNYLLNTTAQTVQPTCNQRSANDATNVQPTMQSQNKIFPSFACNLQTHSSNQTKSPNHLITND